MGRKCPVCGYVVQDGDNFCPEGHDLDAVPAGTGPAGGEETISEGNGNAETMRLDGVLRNGQAGVSAPEPLPAFDEPGPGPDNRREVADPLAEFFTACADFEVDYDVGRVFVEGYFFPFQLRLRPVRDGIEGLFVEIRREDVVINCKRPAAILSRGQRLTVPIPYRPTTGIAGKIWYEIYIGYQVDGESKVYMAQQDHQVFPARANAQSVLTTLKVEYHNHMQMGHAGDMQVDQRLRDLEALRPRADDSAEAVIKQLDRNPIWKPLSLLPCRYSKPGAVQACARPSPESMPSAARCDRLVLQAGGKSVFLYADQRVTLGRGSLSASRSDNADIITRIRLANGRENPTLIRGPDGKMYPISICISRFHGQIEADHRECRVLDQAWYPKDHRIQPSGPGTYLDGVRIQPRGGTVRLPVDKPFSLTLAGPAVSEEGVFGFAGLLYSAGRVLGLCKACACEGNPGELAGLVLKDQLCELETWACVWEALPLAALDPSWGPGGICRWGEGFLARIDHRCEWLVPGRPLTLPGATLQVERFEKGCI